MENKELVKQNINFLENPLWMQNERAVNTGKDWVNNKRYQYTCAGQPPGKLDQLFLYCFMYRVQQEDWTSNIIMTYSQVLKKCGMSCGKKNKQRLDDSISRWEQVRIKFKGTFYDNKKYRIVSFGIINTRKIRENDNSIQIEFNNEWVQSLKESTFFKFVSFDDLKRLRSPISRRLYEILSKSFYQRDTWNIGVFKLAEKIPMQNKYASQIIKKVKTGIKALNNNTDMQISMTVEKTGKNKAVITFVQQKTNKLKPVNHKLKVDSVRHRAELPSQEEPSPNQEPKKAEPVESVIPEKILKMIPQKEFFFCSKLCKTIIKKYGDAGLEYYINLTNSSNPGKNYSGLLNFFFNNNDENFYENHLKALKIDKKVDVARANAMGIQRQEEKKRVEEQKNNALLDKRISNLDSDLYAKFIEYIIDHQEELDKAQRQSFQRQIRTGVKIGVWVQRQFYFDFINSL